MSRFILLSFPPNQIIKTTRDTLANLPYFQKILSKHSDNDICIYLDRDIQAVQHVLNIIRDGPNYGEYPDWIDFEWSFFHKEPEVELKLSDFIPINVGGELFYTTRETLCSRDGWFKSYMERWQRNSTEIFLDRNPATFKEVLSLLRNPTYAFPVKFNYDLEFYGLKDAPITNPNQIVAPFNTAPADVALDQFLMVDQESQRGIISTFKIKAPDGFSVGKAFLQLIIPGEWEQMDIFRFVDKITIQSYLNDTEIDSFNSELLYIWQKLYHKKDAELPPLLLPLHFFFNDEKHFNQKCIQICVHFSNSHTLPNDTFTSRIIYQLTHDNFAPVVAVSQADTLIDHLILQHHQYQEAVFHTSSRDVSIAIPFNHPITQLLFVVQDINDNNFNYLDSVVEGGIYCNGMKMCSFNSLHSVLDRYICGITDDDSDNIPIYSHTFGPINKEHIHSICGSTLNFSRIDTIELRLTLTTGNCKIKIWGLNYNIYCHDAKHPERDAMRYS